jgi:hypothetical protein
MRDLQMASASGELILIRGLIAFDKRYFSKLIVIK